MQFIKDDVAHVDEGRGNAIFIIGKTVSAFLQQHIAIHFRSHDDNRGGAVFYNIARYQSNSIGAVQGAHIAILLVGERFEGRGIDDALVSLLRAPDGIFRH